MQLTECYKAFGGNYQDVRERLQSDALIQRFVIKFLSDNSYERLCNAMKENDYDEAFRAVHTLKGVSQNLSFDRLSASSSLLTELLRERETVPVDKTLCEQFFAQITADYRTVIEAIHKLDAQ